MLPFGSFSVLSVKLCWCVLYSFISGPVSSQPSQWREIKVDIGKHTNKERGNLWTVCVCVCVCLYVSWSRWEWIKGFWVELWMLSTLASTDRHRYLADRGAVISPLSSPNHWYRLCVCARACLCAVYVCTCPMKANLAWPWRWLVLLLSRWANTPFLCRGGTWGGTRTRNQTSPASNVEAE